jgi:glutamate synthase (NADPH/NADH) large chain
MELEGEANDYLGKGLSGAELMVYPDRKMDINVRQTAVGNVALYGATSGTVFIRGAAGERFAVRNSGAKAVVEGLGDHGCEYMTGGIVVVLGPTGRNFASGMSGGIAYVYDPEGYLKRNCNREMVDFDQLETTDKQALFELVNRHAGYTQSPLALQLLADWDQTLSQFVKVLPREYKAALLKMSPRELSPARQTG